MFINHLWILVLNFCFVLKFFCFKEIFLFCLLFRLSFIYSYLKKFVNFVFLEQFELTNKWLKKETKRKEEEMLLSFYFNFVYELCGVEGLVIGRNVVHRSSCVKGVWEKAEPILMCFNFRYSLLCPISHSSLYLKIYLSIQKLL